jgi:hypothetical protein
VQLMVLLALHCILIVSTQRGANDSKRRHPGLMRFLPHYLVTECEIYAATFDATF